MTTTDLRPFLNGGFREVERIDRALADGEIDEPAWYAAMQDLIVPRYLAADNPRAQSGHSGDPAAWEHERLGRRARRRPRALRYRHFERYDRARRAPAASLARPPVGRERRDWLPPRRFDYVHLRHVDYVPAVRRPDLVGNLLHRVCAPGGRLILGPLNEPRAERALEAAVAGWGHTIAGRAERPHRHPEVAYRAFWIDG